MKKDCGCHSHNGFQLSPEGLAQREDVRLEGVDMELPLQYLDKVGSVSGLRRDEEFHVFDDQLIDQQYRRFNNGEEIG